MARVRFLPLCLLSFRLAGAEVAQSPAVVKVLKVFADLDTAQRHPAKEMRVSFALTEAELNEYLRYSLARLPRPGIESIVVKVFPHNYISTYTTVDFDAVEQWMPGAIPSLLKPILYGKRAVWADYRFQAEEGKTRFAVEKAYFEKIPIPAFAVNKMIEVLGARQPERYDTTAPIPLPYGLRKTWTEGSLLRGEN